MEQIIPRHDENHLPLNSIIMQVGSKERYLQKMIAIHFIYATIRYEQTQR